MSHHSTLQQNTQATWTSFSFWWKSRIQLLCKTEFLYCVFSGAYLNQQTAAGLTPIMAAACYPEQLEIVKYLAEKNTVLRYKDRNDQTIIHLAADHNNHKAIEAILNLSKTPSNFMVNENDQYDNTPLHLACKKGYLETVKVLMEHQAEVDNKNEDEKTPFHLAAQEGYVEVVEHILRSNKSVVNDLDEDDNTALHLAATAKMTNTVDALLEHGADVRRKNDMGWTPLDCAAAAGSYKCVLRILDEDAEIDALDRKKTTPLHLTAINGHPQIALLLLDRGARIELENDIGKNALELAIDYGNKSVATAILNSTHWKEAMKTCSLTGKSTLNTPLRMMIRKFPELATMVLDKCIKDKNENKFFLGIEKKDNEFTFDFAFLEDTYNYKKKEEGKGFEYCYDCNDPYVNSALKIQNNHPLMIMNQEKQKSLLKHPVSLALLR